MVACVNSYDLIILLAPEGLRVPTVDYQEQPGLLVFTWTYPLRPNGIITRFVLWANGSAVYNGTALSLNAPLADFVAGTTLAYFLEAFNSAGSTSSPEGTVDLPQAPPLPSPSVPPTGPGLVLTPVEAIVVIVVGLGAVLGTVLLVYATFLLCRWTRRRAMKSKPPAFLSQDFEMERFGVVRAYVLYTVHMCKRRRYLCQKQILP